jgi:hypothetical protein
MPRGKQSELRGGQLGRVLDTSSTLWQLEPFLRRVLTGHIRDSTDLEEEYLVFQTKMEEEGEKYNQLREHLQMSLQLPDQREEERPFLQLKVNNTFDTIGELMKSQMGAGSGHVSFAKSAPKCVTALLQYKKNSEVSNFDEFNIKDLMSDSGSSSQESTCTYRLNLGIVYGVSQDMERGTSLVYMMDKGGKCWLELSWEGDDENRGKLMAVHVKDWQKRTSFTYKAALLFFEPGDNNARGSDDAGGDFIGQYFLCLLCFLILLPSYRLTTYDSPTRTHRGH